MRALGNFLTSLLSTKLIFIWLHVFLLTWLSQGHTTQSSSFWLFWFIFQLTALASSWGCSFVALGISALILHQTSYTILPGTHQEVANCLPRLLHHLSLFWMALLQGLIITCLDCCSSIMTGSPASMLLNFFHHSLFLKPFISKIINLMLSLCLKILNGFPQNTK